MQQIIFLVTSLEGLHKPNFSQKLTQALQQRVPVKLLVGLVDFEANWAVRQYLNRLVQDNPKVKNVELMTLADIVADQPGLTLTPEERNQPDLGDYEERLFADQDQQIKRYLKAGHLAAELRQINDETPMSLRQYHADQVSQIDTYGLDGRVIGVTQYTAGTPTNSYLLNKQGDAALRFVRHERSIEHVYNIGATSAMGETEFANAKQAVLAGNMTQRERAKAEANSVDHTEVITTQEAYYGVLVYATYQRYSDVFAFYQTVLDQLMTAETQLYVDLAVNPVLSPRMPHQLIFNY
ncbi:MAG TPA: hypothetical protein H9875_04575 [Candidatus Levilactobacillus faecigallinarum]|uniref:Uncharacterized protein n=1 Tax=Candidatus Levilactobacillus faecigallinarum TaxID=2838638 RepID=A0A9D1QSL1_9LACO|nr:hypothetical protein [Candidatus Levilactobacillus faecigallinarum]